MQLHGEKGRVSQMVMTMKREWHETLPRLFNTPSISNAQHEAGSVPLFDMVSNPELSSPGAGDYDWRLLRHDHGRGDLGLRRRRWGVVPEEQWNL